MMPNEPAAILITQSESHDRGALLTDGLVMPVRLQVWKAVHAMLCS